MRIYFDLETIPGQAPWIRTEIALEVEQAIAKLHAPRNYKSEEAIERWHNVEAAKLRDDADERYHRCGLDGARGEICSLAWAIDDFPVSTLSRGSQDAEMTEAALLAAFFGELELLERVNRMDAAQWVGHNIIGFDLPFLWKRCVVNNVRPPHYMPRNVKPWSDEVYDTMLRWMGSGGRISQDNLCKALSLPTKEGMTGADVYGAWTNGDIEMIADYNARDVETVRAIYERMTWGGKYAR